MTLSPADKSAYFQIYHLWVKFLSDEHYTLRLSNRTYYFDHCTIDELLNQRLDRNSAPSPAESTIYLYVSISEYQKQLGGTDPKLIKR